MITRVEMRKKQQYQTVLLFKQTQKQIGGKYQLRRVNEKLRLLKCITFCN